MFVFWLNRQLCLQQGPHFTLRSCSDPGSNEFDACSARRARGSRAPACPSHARTCARTREEEKDTRARTRGPAAPALRTDGSKQLRRRWLCRPCLPREGFVPSPTRDSGSSSPNISLPPHPRQALPAPLPPQDDTDPDTQPRPCVLRIETRPGSSSHLGEPGPRLRPAEAHRLPKTNG